MKMKISTFSQLYLWSSDNQLSNTQHHQIRSPDFDSCDFQTLSEQLHAGTVNNNIIYCNAAQNYYLILLLSNTVLLITYNSPPHSALPVGSWSSVTQDTGAGAKVRNMLPYTNLGCSQFYKSQALNKKY